MHRKKEREKDEGGRLVTKLMQSNTLVVQCAYSYVIISTTTSRCFNVSIFETLFEASEGFQELQLQQLLIQLHSAGG